MTVYSMSYCEIALLSDHELHTLHSKTCTVINLALSLPFVIYCTSRVLYTGFIQSTVSWVHEHSTCTSNLESDTYVHTKLLTKCDLCGPSENLLKIELIVCKMIIKTSLGSIF